MRRIATRPAGTITAADAAATDPAVPRSADDQAPAAPDHDGGVDGDDRRFRRMPAVGSLRPARKGRGRERRRRDRGRAPATDSHRTDLQPPQGANSDSWSHYQRRASALAEIFARALQRAPDAADLLALARQLPKGFAGFRAPSALTLADSIRIAATNDDEAHERPVTSALAAAHRIQDYRFCLLVAAAVNAIRSRWRDMRRMDLQAVVDRFLSQASLSRVLRHPPGPRSIRIPRRG